MDNRGPLTRVRDVGPVRVEIGEGLVEPLTERKQQLPVDLSQGLERGLQGVSRGDGAPCRVDLDECRNGDMHDVARANNPSEAVHKIEWEVRQHAPGRQ